MKVTQVMAPVRLQVVEAIRQEIVSGALPPGHRMIERELCEELDVSRNTLREALRQLEAEGFVEIRPYKGPIVARMSEDDARQVYELREALECFAVGLFVTRATSEQVAELGAVVDRLAIAHKSGRVAEMIRVKGEFYSVLYSGACNQVLQSQAGLLNARMAGLRALSLSHQSRPKQSLAEIRSVLTAIEDRNEFAAVERWREHIRNAAATALGPKSEEAALV